MRGKEGERKGDKLIPSARYRGAAGEREILRIFMKGRVEATPDGKMAI